jgi:hypothetical protein
LCSSSQWAREATAAADDFRLPEAVALDVGPSEAYLDRGLLGGVCCYEQTLTLLWDRFAIPGRDALDEIATSPRAAFEAQS